MLASVFKCQRGATSIEYVLIAALVAVICIAAFAGLGDTIFTAHDDTANRFCTTIGKTYTSATGDCS
jgi:Flp pilus assembly pilin Flp